MMKITTDLLQILIVHLVSNHIFRIGIAIFWIWSYQFTLSKPLHIKRCEEMLPWFL